MSVKLEVILYSPTYGQVINLRNDTYFVLSISTDYSFLQGGNNCRKVEIRQVPDEMMCGAERGRATNPEREMISEKVLLFWSQLKEEKDVVS